MKILFSLLAAFSIVGTASACPNLTGTFFCKNPDGTGVNMTYKQRSQNGVEIYNVDGGPDIVADNKLREIPDSPELKNASAQVWCDGTGDSVLEVKMTGDSYTGSYSNGYMVTTSTYSMIGADLHWTSMSMLGTTPLNSVFNCQRVAN